jgi:hypothetical protein
MGVKTAVGNQNRMQMESIWTAPEDSPPAIFQPLYCKKKERVFIDDLTKINIFGQYQRLFLNLS